MMVSHPALRFVDECRASTITVCGGLRAAQLRLADEYRPIKTSLSLRWKKLDSYVKIIEYPGKVAYNTRYKALAFIAKISPKK